MTITLPVFSLSRESVRQVALGVDSYRCMRSRFGRQAADAKLKPRGAGVITTRPLERVELDHFLCDVHLISGKTGARFGRPWLTLAVDHYSGMVVGYHLTFAPPSAASVLAAVRHAILPKKLSSKPSSEGRMNAPEPGLRTWLAYGIPDLLVVDNGLDLVSFGVRDACQALGIDLLFTPPRSPWYKGTVERFGRTMNTRFVHWLPGTTLGKPTSDLGYNGAEHAALTFEDFEEFVEHYITTIHNKTPRRAKDGAPDKRFLRGLQMWPVRVPASSNEFDAAVALTRTTVLRQTGLHFLDLQYQNDQLGELFHRSPATTRLTMKVNPLDLHTIQVRHPASGAFFPVRCISDFEWPRTLSLHTAVRAHAKENDLSCSDRSDLARAERDLMAKVAEAAAKSKRALKRMQADLLRQSQSMGDTAVDNVPSPNVPDDVIGTVFDEVFAG